MYIESIPVTSSLDPEPVASLRAEIKGDVYLPGNDGFDDAIRAWSANIRHAPEIAVMPEDAHDVSRAVTFAHRFGLPVAVQGTGHGVPVACDEGMLINTSRMQRVSIFPDRSQARVEAGVTWEKVTPLAAQHGLAPLNGSASGVGVVGYTLGGGYGWLARKYGRAADRVVAADLVTATGELLHVSADSHPDLFWAIRGGGGNFGIVTALEFDLVPVEEVFGGSVMYPLADAPRVFAAYSQWAESVPDDITSSITILRLPAAPTLSPPLQGAQVVVIRACAVGDPGDGEAAIAPMRSLGTPVMDTFSVMPYTEIDAISMDPKESMPALATTLTLPALDEGTIAALLKVAGPGVETPLVAIEVRDFRRNGQHDTTAGAGSFAGLSLFAVGGMMSPEAKVELAAALDGLRHAMRPHAVERVALNFLGEGDVGPERTRAAFGEDAFARLQDVKRRYDPQNRFRFNHNIAP